MTPTNNKKQPMAFCHTIYAEDGTLYCIDVLSKEYVNNMAMLAITYENLIKRGDTNHVYTPMAMVSDSVGISITKEDGEAPEHSTMRYRFKVIDLDRNVVLYNNILNAVHIDLNGDWLIEVSFNMVNNPYGESDTIKVAWGFTPPTNTTDIYTMFVGGN